MLPAQVLKLNDSKWIQTLENCISLGSPALLENVPETLEPLLDPVLTKSIIKQGARYTIRLGDKEVGYFVVFFGGWGGWEGVVRTH